VILDQGHALDDAARAALLDLWVAAWAQAMPTIDFVARRAWFSAHLDTLLAGGAVLVTARTAADGAPTGFFTLQPGTGEIDQLAVDPRSSGRGIARALLEEAKRLSPDGLHLRVNKINARAMSLYARAGFVVTSETVNARSGLPVWDMAWRP
jgi:putative acetyltransferase